MSEFFAHPAWLFITAFVGLLIAVEIGLRFGRASPATDAAHQSLVDSARNGLTVLLSFLLGFALPMTLPHYESRRSLVIAEANAIGTVEQRAQLLPEPSSGKIRALLRQYVDAELEFAREQEEQRVRASASRASDLQREMWRAVLVPVHDNRITVMTPIVAQAIGDLSDLNEQRLAAYELRTPGPVWSMLLLVSVLTCLVVGYSMRRRSVLAMLVLPLTVATVLSLISELDNPRTGFIRISQESMQRLQLDLRRSSAIDGTL